MDYWIKNGRSNSFDLKEELKAWGCVWVAEKKMWRLNATTQDDLDYKAIKNLGFILIPLQMSKECEDIQRILNNVSAN